MSSSDIIKENCVIHPLLLVQTSSSAVLDEANFLGIAAEALSAAHETILPDYGMRISTNTAGTEEAQAGGRLGGFAQAEAEEAGEGEWESGGRGRENERFKRQGLREVGFILLGFSKLIYPYALQHNKTEVNK